MLEVKLIQINISDLNNYYVYEDLNTAAGIDLGGMYGMSNSDHVHCIDNRTKL